MDHDAMTIQKHQLIGAGILLVGFVLAMVSLFTAWWVVSASAGGNSAETDVKPFSGTSQDSGEIQDEAVVTGVLALLATLGVLACLIAEGATLMSVDVPAVMKWIAPAVAILLGLIAILFTTFAWPDSGTSQDMGFFDSQTQTIFGTQFRITAYAGVGWYFAIVGMLMAPAANLFVNTPPVPEPLSRRKTVATAGSNSAAPPMAPTPPQAAPEEPAVGQAMEEPAPEPEPARRPARTGVKKTVSKKASGRSKKA